MLGITTAVRENNSEFQLGDETSSKADEIYKKMVGGKPLKNFDELPKKIRNSWKTWISLQNLNEEKFSLCAETFTLRFN